MVNINPGGSVVLVINAVVRMTTTIDPLNNIASLVFPGTFTDTNAANDSSTFGLSPSTLLPGGTGVGFTLCANLAGIAPLTVTSAGTVINTFFTPSTNTSVTTLTVGQRCLPTSGVAGIGAAPTALSSLDIGQKLLVMQMQDGNSMTTADSSSYGVGIGNAGAYEYVEVRGLVGSAGCAANEIPITGSNGATLGLANAYSHNPTAVPKQVTQYVRVPQHTDITLSGAGTLAALPWDGLRGGVIAADASGSFDLGTEPIGVDATCAGFRGGGTLSQPVASLPNRGPTRFRRTIAIGNGVKGEGLAGTPRLVFNGSGITDIGGADGYSSAGATARGAPGSAGGGGNACDTVAFGPLPNFETGGGGGAGNGGRGGSGGTCNSNATTGVGAADTGGVQGRIFAGFTFNGFPNIANTEDPTGVGRVTMGSGGGAGAGNASTGVQGAGGLGGGIILLSANSFLGTGDVVSNGCNGQAGGANGGGGGGGAGGTVVLLTNLSGNTTYTGIQVSVVGGVGGNAGIGNNNPDLRGPGGGGGSGRTYISRIANGGSASTATSGGDSGRTDFTPDVLQEQQYGAAAGDNFVEQSNLNAYNSVPGAKPNFICVGGTVPVTLSDVSVQVLGSQLVVQFGTASEAGTLGFRVYQDHPGSTSARMGPELIAAAGDSLVPQRYEVRGEYRGAREVWIEELDSFGTRTTYGPYAVGQSIGERTLATATDWAAVNAELSAYQTRQTQALSTRDASQQSLNVLVSNDGIYSLSHQALIALGVDWTGQASNRLSVSRAGRQVPVTVDGGASWSSTSKLRFYGEAVKNSIYADAAVYRLALADSTSMRTQYAGSGSLTRVDSYRHTERYAPNLAYSFSSPTSDPWFAQRLVRSASSQGIGNVQLAVDQLRVGAAATLTLQVWGGSDLSQSPDHSFAVRLNGSEIGQRQFDGVTAQTVRLEVPNGLLREGSNQVTIELLPLPGVTADVVHLESIELSYPRSLRALGNTPLVFEPAAVGNQDNDRVFGDNLEPNGMPACTSATVGCAAYTIAGVSDESTLYRVRQGQASRLQARRAGSELRFADVAREGDRYLLQAQAYTPELSARVAPAELLAGSGVSYLVITHPLFATELAPLLQARNAQGLVSKVVNVQDIYAQYGEGEVSASAVQRYLQAARTTWPALQYVLLIGGDSYDYKNYLGFGSVSFVPTMYGRTSEFVAYAPLDQLYADVNGDQRADLAIGRLPARTALELRTLVGKILRYEQASHQKRILFANDRDSNGYLFGSRTMAFTDQFTGWSRALIDLNNYPATSAGTLQARQDIVSGLQSGQAVFGFFGHSSPTSWSREGLLTHNLLNQGLLAGLSQPTSVVQLGCWGGYFVDPKYNSVAHGLLLTSGGAASMLSPSAITEVSHDEMLASELFPRLARGLTLGEATRQASVALQAKLPEARDVWLGTTVLGDPAMRINHD